MKMTLFVAVLVSMAVVDSFADHSRQEITKTEKVFEGDLLFLSMPCYVCPLIEETTRSRFSHVGILTQDVKTKHWMVLMALPPKALIYDLGDFLRLVPKPARLSRLKMTSPERRAVTQAARKFVGTEYDPDYQLGSEKLYCSELVYFAFQKALGREVFSLVPMDFGENLDRWAEVLGHPPPQGESGISPGDIDRSPLLEIISDDLQSFFKKN